MKLIYFGDVVGKAGRTAVYTHLPALRDKYQPDFMILNGENAAHGFGITANICQEFFDAGIDVITLGNHSWDQREIMNYIREEPRLLRPLNYPPNTPGEGSAKFETRSGDKVLVAQVMGRLFMEPLDDPFAAVEKCLRMTTLGEDVNCIVVEVHAEATSEKMAIGHEFDGKTSLIVGTHTHIPTADARILSNGTAFITDLGMCGDYDSIIGMDKNKALEKFKKKIPVKGIHPATGEASISCVFVELDDRTGLAKYIKQIIIGGSLEKVS